MQGLYTANGDLSLMLKMDALFKRSSDATYEAPASQRPAGQEIVLNVYEY